MVVSSLKVFKFSRTRFGDIIQEYVVSRFLYITQISVEKEQPFFEKPKRKNGLYGEYT